MTYVMSDIHGYMSLFNSILKQINLTDEDVLYILGDVIDRGPDGIKILLKIMRSKNIFMILGNHEYMMLKYYTGDRWERYRSLSVWASNGCKPTVDQFGYYAESTQNRILKYLRKLPVERRIEINKREYLLCHSQPSINSFKNNPMKKFNIGINYESEIEFSVWHRERINDENFKNLTIIHGHTPVFNSSNIIPLENKIDITGVQINLDCGCAAINYHNNKYNGRLGCLRLEDMKEYYSDTKPALE